MKIKKIMMILPIMVLSLFGCKSENKEPTGLSVSSSEVKMIVNSERDLNDIVTLRFEPKNTTDKSVTWSTNENEFFTLNGSTIKANKIGSGYVTATSNVNSDLKVDVKIRVYNPRITTYKVTYAKNEVFTINGLQDEYEAGSEVSFSINVLDSTKAISEVKANDDVLTLNNGVYKFEMPEKDVTIDVTFKDIIKATSVTLDVTTLDLEVGGKDATISAIVLPNNTTDLPSWSIVEGNEFISITPNANKVTVHALKEGNAKIKVTYNDDVSAECLINVKAKAETPRDNGSLAIYDIKFDLGTRKAPKTLASNDELFNMFETKDDAIIDSIESYEGSLYGGANGGRQTTAWLIGDVLKMGSTNTDGSFTLSLNKEVNRIKITGYTYDKAGKIQVGDSASSDWETANSDNKTTITTCEDLNEVSKDVVENNQTATITIDFASTTSLKIATISSKYPLFITSIEFLFVSKTN